MHYFEKDCLVEGLTMENLVLDYNCIEDFLAFDGTSWGVVDFVLVPIPEARLKIKY